ncbi:MAG: CYTH domain-containing protein [Clostridiales Family XIII bacterium]|jgi:inorganic triphosphatase YgiF|nr:CYTH domain-containing protein [Clostridiales Family XIII bacterium]
MEIELKYKIANAAMLDSIWNDNYLGEIAEPDSREELEMRASYFDTEDRILSSNNIAFRIRKEGAKMVGTLKWRDEDDTIAGLYVRQEVNVPICDENYMISPDPLVFKESEEGRDLLEIIGDEPLSCVLEMSFCRRKVRVDDGNTICEISLDDGQILAGGRCEQICELEIELYTGGQEGLLQIGGVVAKKYGLEPELSSKFARGLKLLEA